MRTIGMLFARFWALASLGAGLLAAEPLSQGERDRLVGHLEQSRRELANATGGLSNAQWNFKPASDRWSIAECYEHIAAVEDFLLDLIAEKVLKTPAQPDKKDAETQRSKDAEILKLVADRTNRAQAPEPLRPVNRYGSLQATQEHFAASRKRTIEFVKSTKEDLRSHFLDHPAIKDLDAFGWFLFLSGHTQRHTAQILEVKALSGFPIQ